MVESPLSFPALLAPNVCLVTPNARRRCVLLAMHQQQQQQCHREWLQRLEVPLERTTRLELHPWNFLSLFKLVALTLLQKFVCQLSFSLWPLQFIFSASIDAKTEFDRDFVPRDIFFLWSLWNDCVHVIACFWILPSNNQNAYVANRFLADTPRTKILAV